MSVSATSRVVRTFEDRAEALAHFFLRAGEAPRLVAYDDAAGCPMDQALAALEWTGVVGLLSDDDLIHAARLGLDSAAAVVERRAEGRRLYVYLANWRWTRPGSGSRRNSRPASACSCAPASPAMIAPG